MNRRETLLGAAALAACGSAGSQAPVTPFPMRRGVNLGNALEAPNEGDWGYRIEPDHLRAIASAGFDGVRLPVRWDAHAESSAPYRVSPQLFQRMDEIVEQALGVGLRVQVDLHHYDALIAAPYTHAPRFVAIWAQIAAHFQNAPPGLFFEPLNEPNGTQWSSPYLHDVQTVVVNEIRRTNPTRLIVLGPGNWQNIDALRDWRPPEGENIGVSVHYYEPHAFTHQRAEWLGDDAPAFGRDWGTAADRRQVREHIRTAARWGREHGYAMQLGEFGVNRAVSVQQRAAWTRMVREACEAEDMGWCVWDFAGAFPVWDRETREFIPLMRDALLA